MNEIEKHELNIHEMEVLYMFEYLWDWSIINWLVMRLNTNEYSWDWSIYNRCQNTINEKKIYLLKIVFIYKLLCGQDEILIFQYTPF